MNKKLVILIVIIIIVGIWAVEASKDGSLTSPNLTKVLNKTNPTPEPINNSPVAPKTFQYDASSDLKIELDSINPEVLDSDFE